MYDFANAKQMVKVIAYHDEM